MEKQLKDYLHLYLGCEAAIGYDPVQFPKAGMRIDKIVDVGLSGAFTSNSDLEKFEDVKPLLRPLSDMTDKEIDELASVLLEKETHCFKKWRSEDGKCIIAEWKKEKPQPPYDKEYEYMTMGMLINGDFSIKHKWDYHSNKETGTTNEPLHNYQEITRYLLSKHFDIYNLIESGLAIDKTKTP